MAPKKKKTEEENEEEDIMAEKKTEDEQVMVLELPKERIEYVTLQMNLLNWNYMNFKIRTKTTTQLFVIKKEIKERHGRISDLKICKDQFSERTEMQDEMLCLQDYGIKGASEDQPEVRCTIYYDFKPYGHDDPILLAS